MDGIIIYFAWPCFSFDEAIQPVIDRVHWMSKDKFIFKVPSNKVTVSNNKITVENESSIGDYTIILSNVTNITNLSDYSTFS